MFRLWAVLTSTLTGSLESKSLSALSPQPASTSPPWVLVLRSYLLSSNSMLRLLAEHDVYRINEDWGGLEFDKIRGFSASLIRLAESDIAAARGDDGGAVAEVGPRSTGAAMPISGDEQGGAASTADAADAAAVSSFASREENESGAGAGTGAAQEFLRAFSSLLGLNHNILHDDLRPVLRMTFQWAAAARTGAAAVTAATDRKPNGSVVGPGNRRRRISGGGGGGNDDVEVLRSLAVGLVVSLVDTYGRLRQMDHLVRALFGAIADRPEAAAALVRTDECTAALARAFRRLPEGQIESMWDVFTVHLREGWNRGGTGVGRGELLAREVDAEMFVLFVRNLHVTSSVASTVGKLCTDLADESLRSFALPLQQAAAAAAAVAASCSPPSSSSKKKKKKRKSGEHGGGGGGGMTVEAMLSFRPALDVHGWLLDLDTRCRFWSAVLDSSSAAAPVTAATAAPPDAEGDTLVEEHDGEKSVPGGGGGGGGGGGVSTVPLGSLATSGARTSTGEGQEMTELPRIVAAAAAALGTVSSGWAAGAEGGAGVDDTAGVRRRLEMTLQQVAVHRVQQIYARLNGVAALEGAAAAEEEVPSGSGVEGEDESDGEGRGSKDRRGEEARLEEEARDLVAFACRACGGAGAGSAGAGVSAGGWGDGDRECGGRGGGASWSMMMPYLPVWVGFAAREQVALFLEALFSRCASDVLAGRGGEESPPLRLVSDASFYEMEAVAQAAPAVILAKVYGAVKRATSTRSDTGGGRSTTAVASVGALSSVEALVAAVKALASGQQDTAPRGNENNPDISDRSPRESASAEAARDSSSGAASSEGGEERRRALEVELLEACCLVMTTERFPPGFLDEGALAGLLAAADALDAVLTRCLLLLPRGRGGGAGGGGSDEEEGRTYGDSPAGLVNFAASGGLAVPSTAVRHRAALVEAVAALRRLALRLGRALTPESSLLGGLSHADALLRVIGPASGAMSGVAASRSLLRASANLLPLLAERCVVEGDTKTALKAIVGLGLIKPRAASDIGKAVAATAAGEKRRRQRGHPPLASAHPLPQTEEREGGREREDGASSGRLVLLHGVLSGFVAGESRRLADHAAAAVAAGAAASGAVTMNTGMDLDSDNDYDDDGYDDDGLGGVANAALERTHQQQHQQPQPQLSAALDQRLVATVSHLAGCLPAPGASTSEPLPSPTAVPPPLLLVWSDALRLSFLGADAQRLVFSGRTSEGVVRTRSRWVEDCVAYLARRLESADDGGGGGDAAGRSGTGPAVAMPSERSACCHLVRAVCGCSHLLDPPLPRLSVRRLVGAFVGIVGAATPSGDGDYFDADGGSRPVQRAEEDLVLDTAFCLLVQYASEAQLDEIVSTLLEMLGGDGGDATMTAAAAATPSASLPSLRSPAAQPTAVSLLRLAMRAGRGAAFKAVVPRHALSLASSLCRQLRGATDRGSDGGGGGGGRHDDEALGFLSTYGRNSICGSSGGGDAASGANECDRLRNATGALEALEGLLDRQPYSSITARVVSVVLGAVEPAARAALDAMAVVDTRGGGSGESRSSSSGNSGGGGDMSSVVRESLVCFRACCRVVGTVLQHYARKVYSCTPPFASLCRSLLRLFFRLSSAPAPAASGAAATAAARRGAPAGSSNARGEKRRNPNATAPSAAASGAADTDGSGSGSGGRLALSIEEQVAAASVFSRVLEQFVPHKEVLKKYAAFLLLEYVSLSGAVALEPAPRAALLSGVFAVMQACSTREMRQLHRLLGALPTGTGQEVFRSLNEEYQRQHKYVGKM